MIIKNLQDFSREEFAFNEHDDDASLRAKRIELGCLQRIANAVEVLTLDKKILELELLDTKNRYAALQEQVNQLNTKITRKKK